MCKIKRASIIKTPATKHFEAEALSYFNLVIDRGKDCGLELVLYAELSIVIIFIYSFFLVSAAKFGNKQTGD